MAIIRRSTSGFILLSLAAVLAGSLVLILSPSDSIERGYEIQGEADENPAARLEWELKRLRDPATGRIPDDIRHRELAYASTLPGRTDRSAFMKGLSGNGVYDWEWRGPYNMGGRTRAFACDITGEDTLLAGGVSGGMWRSSDGGDSWTRATRLDQLASATSIVQDTRPGKTHIWYYGTGELLGNSAVSGGAWYHGDGIFKSTDNGRSWQQIPSTVSNTPAVFDRVTDNGWRVAVDPSNLTQDEVYAALYGTIYRSTNGGGAWSTVLSGRGKDGNITGYFTDIAVTRSGVAYATISSNITNGWSGGIWRSTNGTTWSKISPEFWPDTVNRVVIGIAPSHEDVVYFLAETPSKGFKGLDFRKREYWSSLWKYTYVSGDGTGAGGTWEDRSENLPAFGNSFGDFQHQGSYDLHIHVKPDDENVVFIGGTNLYRSTDGFATRENATWIGGYQDIAIDSNVIVELEYPNHHPDQHEVFFSPSNPNVMYTGSDGGVHKTLDAMASNVEWINLNHGYGTTQFYTVAVDHGTPGDTKVVGGLQDNGTWGNMKGGGNLNWDRYGTGDGSYCSIADGGGELFVSKQQGKTYRVILNADGTQQTWTRIDPLGAKNYQFINPFRTDPVDQKIIYMLAGQEIWRNSDVTAISMESQEPATTNWTRLANARDNDTSGIVAISVSTAAPQHRLYYGTDDGRVYRMDNAVADDPIGTEVTGSNFPSDAYVSCIAVDPLDGDRAIVVFSNYGVISLYLTEDAGTSWTPVAGNLEQNANGSGNGPSCRWASILHRPNGTLYLVGTSTGLYSTYKLGGNGTQWYLEGPNTIGNVVVDMIDARQSDGFVAIATHANGVFSTTVATVGVEETTDVTATALRLEQNVPNPVTDRTSISFVLPAITQAKITLHDISGRLIETLIDGRLTAGKHSVPFAINRTSGRLPAGTYYYRLEADGRVVTRGMLVE